MEYYVSGIIENIKIQILVESSLGVKQSEFEEYVSKKSSLDDSVNRKLKNFGKVLI